MPSHILVWEWYCKSSFFLYFPSVCLQCPAAPLSYFSVIDKHWRNRDWSRKKWRNNVERIRVYCLDKTCIYVLGGDQLVAKVVIIQHSKVKTVSNPKWRYIYLYKIRLDLKVDDLSYDSLLSVCCWLRGCNVKFTRCPTTLNRASHLEKKHHGELGGSPLQNFNILL